MQYEPASTYSNAMSDAAVQQAISAFVTKVFGWMAVGLLLTGVVAAYVAQTPSLVQTIFAGNTFIILIVAEIGLVIVLSAAITKLSAGAASVLFLLYSAVNGLTFSVIFLVYTASSIGSTFIVTAGTFGAMFIYGYVTKKDLTSLGSLCFMGLIGMIIASVVNMFVASSSLYWIITYGGILVFVGLTAYDAQKIKMTGAVSGALDPSTAHKAAILGALALYLDFINLFLLLLRLLGRRR